jgi:hypothetical protein
MKDILFERSHKAVSRMQKRKQPHKAKRRPKLSKPLRDLNRQTRLSDNLTKALRAYTTLLRDKPVFTPPTVAVLVTCIQLECLLRCGVA